MIRDVTDWDFEAVVERSSRPVLVEFWQPDCGHCRALLRELERLQDSVGERILIAKMNVQENYQIPAELGITSLPVLALYEQGTFSRFIGGIGQADHIKQQLPLA